MSRCIAWLIVADLVACGDSPEALCTPPGVTTYSCAPLAPGSIGCVGGPKWSPAGSADGGLRQDDADKTFPSGCTAKIPDCSPYYMGEPREFACEGTSWVEPI